MRGEKEKSMEEKKCALVAKVFFLRYAYSTDLNGRIFARVNREGKSHADWTNQQFGIFSKNKP